MKVQASTRHCDECGSPFETTVFNARFCGNSCRYAAWDRKHPRTRAKQPYNGSEGGKRRASRDGKGTRLYLTAPELIEVYGGRVPGSVMAKAMRAMERITDR